VYDRHRYDAEKADALNKLAHLIETIIKPEEKVTVAETSRTASAVVIAGGSGELSAAAKAW